MKLWIPFRRWLAAWNMAAALGLAALLVVMVQYLADRHYARFDATRTRPYALSAETQRLLDSLPGPVRMVVFLDRAHDLYEDVTLLLRNYAQASRRVQVEWVDPHRDLARSKEYALRYDLREPDVLVLEVGDRRRIVPAADLADYDYTPTLAGRARVLRQFRGEPVLSSALLGLSRTRKPVIYFLAGHGEHQVDQFDPQAGYSIIARLLDRQGLESRPLSFSGRSEVPADADALVIAGPTRRLVHQEAEMVRRYLDNHGRLFLMADPGVETGLEKLLEQWGVRLGADRVVGSPTAGHQVLVTAYGEHPITARLKNMTTIFNLPRSIQPLVAGPAAGSPADKPRVTVLASTGAEGWADRSVNQAPPIFDRGVDQEGPIPVAVAIEKGPARDMDVEIQPTRLVVAGDSMLVANGPLLGGYAPDFFISALNWLVQQEDAVPIIPREPALVRAALDRAQWRRLAVAVVLGMPALAVLLGLGVWARRRR